MITTEEWQLSLAKHNLKQKEKLQVLLPHHTNHMENLLKYPLAGNLMPFDVISHIWSN
jgi:hypothetical protein